MTAEVFSWLTHGLGLTNVSMWMIPFFSTIPERVLLWFLCLIVLGMSFCLRRFLSSLWQCLLPVVTSFALFFILYTIFPFQDYLFPGNHPVAVAVSLTLVIAIVSWRLRLRDDSRQVTGWLPAAVIVSAVAVLLLNGWSLRGLARVLHADPAVQQFGIGHLNDLEFDAEQDMLFATGHGTNYLLAYNVNALDQAPRRSSVEIGGAQALAYNTRDRELYILNPETQALLFFDGTTLALKKVVPDLKVARGDAWITWNRHTDEIIIASEYGFLDRQEEEGDGYPMVVINRTTGNVSYTMELVFFNVFLHPRKPLYYMNFSKRLLAYDTEARKIVCAFEPERSWFLQRMDMTPDQGELLVAAPVDSAILRFHPDTLELKGRIDTVFGVRTLAVDPARNLLLTASLISNMLEVIDLKTNDRVARYYIGPWLRTIVLDTERGVAYVSSIESLFRVDYARPIENRVEFRAGPEKG